MPNKKSIENIRKKNELLKELGLLEKYYGIDEIPSNKEKPSLEQKENNKKLYKTSVQFLKDEGHLYNNNPVSDEEKLALQGKLENYLKKTSGAKEQYKNLNFDTVDKILNYIRANQKTRRDEYSKAYEKLGGNLADLEIPAQEEVIEEQANINNNEQNEVIEENNNEQNEVIEENNNEQNEVIEENNNIEEKIEINEENNNEEKIEINEENNNEQVINEGDNNNNNNNVDDNADLHNAQDVINNNNNVNMPGGNNNNNNGNNNDNAQGGNDNDVNENANADLHNAQVVINNNNNNINNNNINNNDNAQGGNGGNDNNEHQAANNNPPQPNPLTEEQFNKITTDLGLEELFFGPKSNVKDLGEFDKLSASVNFMKNEGNLEKLTPEKKQSLLNEIKKRSDNQKSLFGADPLRGATPEQVFDYAVGAQKRRLAVDESRFNQLNEEKWKKIEEYTGVEGDANKGLEHQYSVDQANQGRAAVNGKILLHAGTDANRLTTKGMLQNFAKEYGKMAQELAKDLPAEDLKGLTSDEKKKLKSINKELSKQALNLSEKLEAYGKMDVTASIIYGESDSTLAKRYKKEVEAYKELEKLSKQFNDRLTELYENPPAGYHEDSELNHNLLASSTGLNAYFADQKMGSLYTGLDHTGGEPNAIAIDGREKPPMGKIPGEKMFDASNMPLFPHEPSPNDIHQGLLGDCYLLAGLSDMAEKQPNALKDCMVDNDNGTVTVRFFQRNQGKDGEPDTFDPVYVTVDKQVPEAGGASNCLWAQMIERAYAASGLHMGDGPYAKAVPADIDEQYAKLVNTPREEWPSHEECPWLISPQGELHPWEPKYSDIDGGVDRVFMGHLMGPRAVTEKIAVPVQDRNDYHGRFSGEYGDSINKFYDTLKQNCKDGVIMSTSIVADNKPNEKKRDGLYKGHAYNILGVEERTIDGKKTKFVKLRNPHGTSGRIYKKDKHGVYQRKEAKNLPGGIFEVELNDFVNDFGHIDASTLHKEPQKFQNDPKPGEVTLSGDVMKSYGRGLAYEIQTFNSLLAESNGKLPKAAENLGKAIGSYHGLGIFEGQPLKDVNLDDLDNAAKGFKEYFDKKNPKKQTELDKKLNDVCQGIINLNYAAQLNQESPNKQALMDLAAYYAKEYDPKASPDAQRKMTNLLLVSPEYQAAAQELSYAALRNLKGKSLEEIRNAVKTAMETHQAKEKEKAEEAKKKEDEAKKKEEEQKENKGEVKDNNQPNKEEKPLSPQERLADLEKREKELLAQQQKMMDEQMKQMQMMNQQMQAQMQALMGGAGMPQMQNPQVPNAQANVVNPAPQQNVAGNAQVDPNAVQNPNPQVNQAPNPENANNLNVNNPVPPQAPQNPQPPQNPDMMAGMMQMMMFTQMQNQMMQTQQMQARQMQEYFQHQRETLQQERAQYLKEIEEERRKEEEAKKKDKTKKKEKEAPEKEAEEKELEQEEPEKTKEKKKDREKEKEKDKDKEKDKEKGKENEAEAEDKEIDASPYENEMLRLKDRLLNSGSRGSESFKGMVSEIANIPAGLGSNDEPAMKKKSEIKKNMEGLLKTGREYQRAHRNLDKFSSTQINRLKSITRLQALENMIDKGIDPNSREGQEMQMADKLIMAAAEIDGRAARLLCSPRNFAKEREKLMQSDAFQDFVDGMTNKDLKANLKVGGKDMFKKLVKNMKKGLKKSKAKSKSNSKQKAKSSGGYAM